MSAACSEIAREASVLSASSLILGTIPEVLIVILFLDKKYADSSLIISADSITGSKFKSGSPIPINTTLVIGVSSLS